jgi:dihydroflavonol-4-reductase
MILVTGGSGLVAQHLLEALLKTGEKIRATYRNEIPSFFTNISTDKIDWFECDLLDIPSLEPAFENITHVYHCAAMVSYDPRKKEEMLLVNIEGTANIVNLCLDKKIEKLCHVSSISTLSDGVNNELISEKNDWEDNPDNSNYSISKQGAEMEVWRGIAEGLQAVIINPGIILGEGNILKSSSNLFKIIHDEFPYYTQGITAWVDVKDVANIMIGLMKSAAHSERFIVSAGNYSYLEIFSMMAKYMNKKPPYKLASPWMTELVWRFSYLKSIITGNVATITKETARSSQKKRKFNNSKLLQTLGDFKYTKIEETIERASKIYSQ